MTQEKNTQRIENVSTEQHQAIIRTRQEVDAHFEALRNKPQYSHTEANSTYKISNHTAEWIRIYKALGEIWNDISNIVWVETGRLVDENMDKYFVPHLSALQEAILKEGILGSIAETMGAYDDDKMI